MTKEQYEKLLVKYPELKGNEVHDSTHSIGFKLSAGQLIELAGFKGRSE